MSRARGVAITGLIVGSGIALMSYLPTWVSFARRGDGLPSISSTFTGRQVAPAAAALALAVLAGAFAVWALRGWWVRAAGVLLLAASGYLVFVPIRFAADPESRLMAAVRASGVDQGGVFVFAGVTMTWWWIPALIGGLIALAASFIVVFHRGRWGGISARYERAGADTGPSDLSAPRAGAAAWDALDRGDDPTVQPPDASAGEGPTASPGAADGT
jgi:uncharacterized membrane protein (TIGR02234 family)